MQQAEFENSNRPKTQQRLRQEAQAEVIRKKHGGLEQIREKLGFSQKQMGELLLVDASAWSRWIKPGENAPPHIYQALGWYLETLELQNLKQNQLVQESTRDIRSVFKSDLAHFDFAEKAFGVSDSEDMLGPHQVRVDSSALNEAVSDVAEKMALWEIEKNQLAEKLKKSEALQAGWKLFLILNSFVLFYLIVNRYFSF